VLLHANKTRVNTSSSVKQLELNQDNASVILLIVLIALLPIIPIVILISMSMK
jgi:hypothetical protein